MSFFLSRQSYWPTGDYVVEIAGGGLDYANADMLVEVYPNLGEGQEYTDPREAVKAALSIRDAWALDTADPVRVECGYTGGWTVPFEEEPTDDELKEWAKKQLDALEKCGECGEILGDEKFFHALDPEARFCSMNCADVACAKIEAEFSCFDECDNCNEENCEDRTEDSLEISSV